MQPAVLIIQAVNTGDPAVKTYRSSQSGRLDRVRGQRSSEASSHAQSGTWTWCGPFGRLRHWSHTEMTTRIPWKDKALLARMLLLVGPTTESRP